jgi:hemolysin activation/secretion protein
LGGAGGVRAYPLGEGYGDQGWLVQTELRLSLGDYTPYVFFDVGRVTIDKNPWTAGDNSRQVSGAGLGFRANLQRRWLADVSLAWRTSGGPPQSDTRDVQPVLRASLAYKF